MPSLSQKTSRKYSMFSFHTHTIVRSDDPLHCHLGAADTSSYPEPAALKSPGRVSFGWAGVGHAAVRQPSAHHLSGVAVFVTH
jgi:hypothetical protein